MERRRSRTEKIQTDKDSPGRSNIVKTHLSKDELKTLQIAAAVAEKTQSEFMREAMLERAHAVVRESDLLKSISDKEAPSKK